MVTPPRQGRSCASDCASCAAFVEGERLPARATGESAAPGARRSPKFIVEVRADRKNRHSMPPSRFGRRPRKTHGASRRPLRSLIWQMDQYANAGLVLTRPNVIGAVDNTFAEAVARARSNAGYAGSALARRATGGRASEVIGRASTRTPHASATALAIAGPTPPVLSSPALLAPNGPGPATSSIVHRAKRRDVAHAGEFIVGEREIENPSVFDQQFFGHRVPEPRS